MDFTFRYAETMEENLLLHGKTMFENTVQVVAPGKGGKGSIVTHLGQPRADAGFVRRDLVDAAGEIAPSAPTTKLGYPLSAEQTNATDNQIIRLGDGTLLGVKNGYLWSDLADAPEWFDEVSIDLSDAHQDLGRARNGVFVFASTDGGSSWAVRSILDSAVMEDGKYGWPQPDDEQPFWVGGFDRTEAYHDPWSGDVFLSAHGDGGPFQKKDGTTESNHAGLVFRSTDGGTTWTTLYDQFGSSAPYEMTSTADHSLVVFRNTGKGPWLHTMPRGTDALDAGESVAVGSVAIGTDQTVADVGWSPVSVGRYGTNGDEVVIAYPTLNADGRQTYQLAVVTLVSGGGHQVQPLTQVEATDPSTFSCLLGTFVDDQDPSDGSGVTLFYWVEAAPAGSADAGELVVRALAIAEGWISKPMTLSVGGGGDRTFGRLAIGHYVHGASFRMEGATHFLAQWAEPDGIKGNVVSVHQLRLPRWRRPEGKIDPLALILSNDIYVLLTLPDPPPDEVVIEQAGDRIQSVAPLQRRSLPRRIAAAKAYVEALEREIGGR